MLPEIYKALVSEGELPDRVVLAKAVLKDNSISIVHRTMAVAVLNALTDAQYQEMGMLARKFITEAQGKSKDEVKQMLAARGVPASSIAMVMANAK